MEKRQAEYHVPYVTTPLHIRVEVPGSKSITNRALLLAAMAEGESVLEGVLFSDDSNYFFNALRELGVEAEADEQKKTIKISGTGGKIPKKSADIFVGSAGTAARFLTAFLAMCDGEFRLDASGQMKKRPMKELLAALEELGVKIDYEEKKYHFPFRLRGLDKEIENADIALNIDRSSQFLSALLLAAPLRIGTLHIHLTGKRSAKSYVDMTEQMMKQFGHRGVVRQGENDYQVCKDSYEPQQYEIEPDVSAACYFYAMAAVTGGSAVVERMRKESLQGDMRFLSVLEKMGCVGRWEEVKTDADETEKKEFVLYGPAGGRLHGVNEDFSDFSDQTLTMAAIAPFADSPVTIRGISHIRGQESDRIAVIKTELRKIGIRCEESGDGIIIYPENISGGTIQTYEDHRVAMAFAITGLRVKGLVIAHPECCKKTFPEYFEVLDSILE